ncbi:type IV pilin protein [Thiomonas intermedia]|uniref:type IV pilin protein n=1 Tax=Thiomonas intermedia TaxID=926 RepID=UPI0009A51E57|nr:prepilin-type N-terminal cleavage/methylation domain-containing protein [Thiomonas intermedia]
MMFILPPPIQGKRLGGFTLLELLMALVLIGVLTAIALPIYSGYRLKIENAQVQQDVVSISAAIQSYWIYNRALPNTLADIGMGGKLYPCGNPYVYYNIEENGKGHARKDKALNPINTDFDPYRMGQNGQTKSQISNKVSLDDIIRANNGAYVGLASNY